MRSSAVEGMGESRFRSEKALKSLNFVRVFVFQSHLGNVSSTLQRRDCACKSLNHVLRETLIRRYLCMTDEHHDPLVGLL